VPLCLDRHEGDCLAYRAISLFRSASGELQPLTHGTAIARVARKSMRVGASAFRCIPTRKAIHETRDSRDRSTLGYGL
jgi:hypothetical protein